MRNNLPLPSMFRPIPRIEQPSPDTDESVVEIRLDEARPVTIDDGDGFVIGDGDVIRCDAEEFAYRPT